MTPPREHASTKSSLNVRRILRDAARMYFAPLTGAYKGIRDEYRRLDAEADRQREAEAIGRRADSPPGG
jgi:hypothetical protein